MRNRAAAVRRRDFDENMLMQDYALLEEAGRASAASVRATAASAPAATSASARSKRAILAREAATRNVHLHLLPQGFARGKRNSSHARGRKGTRQLFWHVDVVFVQPGRERRVNVDSCADSATVAEIVAGATEALMRKNRRREAAHFADVSVDQLDVFILNEHVVGPTASGPEHVPVAGKAVGEDDMHRYLPLGKLDALAKVLSRRIIIEFPIIYCAVKESAESQRLTGALAGVFEKPEPESDSDAGDSDDSRTASASDVDGALAGGEAIVGSRGGDGGGEVRPRKRSRNSTPPGFAAGAEATVKSRA